MYSIRSDLRLFAKEERTMRMKIICYWTATILIALETFAGGCMDLMHGRTNVFGGTPVLNVIKGLGYPAYILMILGVLKIPGSMVLIIPRFLRLKEWAYAGIVFELSGAAASQIISSQQGDLLATLILLGLALASWALRPQSRILGRLLPVKA